MLVPAWSSWEDFWALEAAGLTMFGQMTAAGWFYIGTQGVLGFTYETFRAVARRHFGGTLDGCRVLTAGLGGMGGAQGLGITLNGGRALIVEVDPARAERRAAAGGSTSSPRTTARRWQRSTTRDGPAGDRAGRQRRRDRCRGSWPTASASTSSTDQTAAHDLLHGYVPIGHGPEEAADARADDGAYLDAVRASLARHVEALLGFRERGAVVFEYGNGLRAQARDAGVDAADEIPGFIDAYVREMLAGGIGPYRWVCADRRSRGPRALGGRPQRGRRAPLRCGVGSSSRGARVRRRASRRGSAGSAWASAMPSVASSTRSCAAARSARSRSAATTWIPRSVASPTRETERMRDGSDAIADWPVLSAMLNAAQGASWVAIGNGGGVGIGRSIHSGMVVVADGSELAERKIDRVFWSDPALGVARYPDAGYEQAAERAREAALDVPR